MYIKQSDAHFSNAPPVVLCFSGLDPSGGAGIQADIETLASIGCHCAPIITTLTAQDTCNVQDTHPVPAPFLIEQARIILADMPVRAFKLGLIGSIAQVEAIHTIIKDYPHIPVIFDPIIRAGGGCLLTENNVIEAIENLILPWTFICTPNTDEAKKLSSQADSIEACAHEIIAKGAEAVLITGTHDNTSKVVNRLWHGKKQLLLCEWDRLEGHYHGSGCTLASSLAGYIAHGMDLVTAAREAQNFTWKSLKSARSLGKGQLIPNRLFWSK